MKLDIIKNAATGKLARVVGKLDKHSPEILVGSGVVGVVASAVLACRATVRAQDVVEEARDEIDAVRSAAEEEDLPEKEVKRDLTHAYARLGLGLAKLYAPSVALGAASIGCILTSNGIMRKRNASLVAAYSALDGCYRNYRERVAERLGEQTDREIAHDVTCRDVEVEEDGKAETRNVRVTGDPGKYSPYARFFDETCPSWEKNPEYNLMFLRCVESNANDRLRAQGWLLLNDVYEMLGIPKTNAGMVVGWTYVDPDKGENPNGDNYISFGIYDLYKQGCRDFVNGYERSILLDFNVDGVIYDKI